MLAKVQGGTGAGEKMHIPAQPKTPWYCTNGHWNPRFAVVCLTAHCRCRRPR